MQLLCLKQCYARLTLSGVRRQMWSLIALILLQRESCGPQLGKHAPSWNVNSVKYAISPSDTPMSINQI